MTLVRTTSSVEGRALGKEHARLYELELSKRPMELDDRCATCAFRPGTLPNGAATTQLDVLKCLMEHVDFNCHHKGRTDSLCHGYKILKPPASHTPVVMPWAFSYESPPITVPPAPRPPSAPAAH